MTKLNILTIALLSSSLALPSPAAAQDRVSATVSTAGLDLASEAGRKALDRRLAHAVIQVCGEASPADLEGQNAVRACRVESRALAEVQQARMIAQAAKGGTILVAAAR